MKKNISMLIIACIMLTSLVGCSSGVSQDDLDKVITENARLASEIAELKEAEPVVEPLSESSQPSESAEPVKLDKPPTNTPVDDLPKGDSNFPYEVFKTESEEIIVKTVNKSGEQQRIEIEATYYLNGKMLDVRDESFIGVIPERTIVCTISEPYDDNYNEVAYDDVQIQITAELDDYYTDLSENVSFEHNQGVNDIIIKATSNSDIDISYPSFAVLFYQADKVVGCSSDTASSITANATASFKISFPKNNEYELIPFDRYEVFLIDATD